MALTVQQHTATAKAVDSAVLNKAAVTPAEVIAKFKATWPTAKNVLNAIKAITSDKVDAIINEVITFGDTLAGTAPGSDIGSIARQLCDKWNLIRPIIAPIATLLPGKAGRVTREFVNTVDQITDPFC